MDHSGSDAAEEFRAHFAALDALARQCADDPNVLGFMVIGSERPYAAQWNQQSRAPLRWRSGEWRLFGGCEAIAPLYWVEEETPMREAIVKVYKDGSKGGNGAFAMTTTATDPDEFLRELAVTLEVVLEHTRGDWQFTLCYLLPQTCDLWAKLKGYKADSVFERRLLTVGAPMPEAHMSCLNEAWEPVLDEEPNLNHPVVE